MGKGNRKRSTTPGKRQEAEQSSLYGRLVKIGAWTLAALFVFVFAFAVLHTTGVLQRSLTALAVGDEKISSLDFNIYYTDILNDFLDQYGSTLEMYGYTIDSSFESQISLFGDGEQTWRDYFREQAVANATQVLTLYQEGKAAGHEMSDYYVELMQQSLLDNVAYRAAYYGMSTEGFISSAYGYGNGTKLADLTRVYERNYYATSYAEVVVDGFVYTDEDIEAVYQENRATYDAVDYYAQTFDYETYTFVEPAEGESVPEGKPQSAEEAARVTEESMAEAKAVADEFVARLKAGEEFDALALEIFFAEESTHTHEDEAIVHEFETALTTKTPLTDTDEITAWATAEERAEGDIEVIDTGTEYTVVQFVSRYRVETPTVTARHILFQYTEITDDMSETDKYTAEFENNQAVNQAINVYNEWRAGEATEESFAALAKEHTDDGNGLEGGIYEHFAKGTMVTEFDEWCFDPERRPGDTEMVLTEFGMHIIYFVSKDQPAYYYTILNSLKNEAFTEYQTGVNENYSVSTSKFAMSVCF